ncbi:hypothetical protein O6H91_18G047500 [Diphasiastrum complanatum]|uniref:Uncharacterized protein n=1 Tax=Diphasiastrum complanatum TaxID=34168 RepID=A0ACC2B0P6_DIPCM|nr:hypothetical protein O6H91_18G047500 [Diphasiastrum complanatum]
MPQLDESRPVERPHLILLPGSQIVDVSIPSAISSKETPVGKGSEIVESHPSMPDIQLSKPKPRRIHLVLPILGKQKRVTTGGSLKLSWRTEKERSKTPCHPHLTVVHNVGHICH